MRQAFGGGAGGLGGMHQGAGVCQEEGGGAGLDSDVGGSSSGCAHSCMTMPCGTRVAALCLG
jgi:hypothetical protein